MVSPRQLEGNVAELIHFHHYLGNLFNNLFTISILLLPSSNSGNDTRLPFTSHL